MSSLTSPSSNNLNTKEKVEFREKILLVEKGLLELVNTQQIDSKLEDCTLEHFFTPKHEGFGCHVYGRQMLIPKGTVIIGKIHRHRHLNVISKGKVSVITEHGKKEFTAPCTFVSELGLKRAVYAEEDTLWLTVHLTSYGEESDLDKIEDEVIAKTYLELDMTSSLKSLEGE